MPRFSKPEIADGWTLSLLEFSFFSYRKAPAFAGVSVNNYVQSNCFLTLITTTVVMIHARAVS